MLSGTVLAQAGILGILVNKRDFSFSISIHNCSNILFSKECLKNKEGNNIHNNMLECLSMIITIFADQLAKCMWLNVGSHVVMSLLRLLGIFWLRLFIEPCSTHNFLFHRHPE